MSQAPPKPPAADEIEDDPEVADDLTELSGEDIAIELPVEPGDPDGQPV